jgi:hypothetical protein
MLKGDELVGWAPREKLSEISAAPEKDYYELFGESDYFPLNEGYFMIFFRKMHINPDWSRIIPNK